MDQFCCVKCGRVFSLGEASLLFRTGFFRVEHRLGCCRSCYPEPAVQGDADDASLPRPEAAGTGSHPLPSETV